MDGTAGRGYGRLVTDEPQPPAGWRPDPEDPGSWRYWDGRAWTDDRAPMTAPKGEGGASSMAAISGPWAAALAFLGLLVVGSLYNGQVVFAVGWLALLCGIFVWRTRR